ncbi:MAG TPA: polymer-forming cytoskeletal protein [Thermoanaerobaculia bacterium]|nr:polymer-forming cytoskeletal protein [Thermoanaerobaculia bacterium]
MSPLRRADAGRLLSAAALLLSSLPLRAAPAARPALVVSATETRNGDLVATLRDVRVDGVVKGTLVSIGGSATITGVVEGDVVLFGGQALVSGDGRIRGRLLAMGGAVAYANGAASERSVGGGVRSFASMEAAFLSELRTSPFLERSSTPLLLALRLFLLAGWMLLGAAILFAKPRRLSGAVRVLDGHLLLVTVIGTFVAATALLVSVLLFAVFPARAALGLVSLLVLALFAAKVFGLVALFVALGRSLASRAPRSSPFFGDPAALAIGLLALGCASLVPAAGALVWILASLAGIGLSILSGFGRRDEALV